MTNLTAINLRTALQDETKSIASAINLPKICYVDEAFYQHKEPTLLRPNWLAIGLGTDALEKRWFKPRELAGVLLLITHNAAEEINAFRPSRRWL